MLREAFGDDKAGVFYHGVGCRHCRGTGYRGRTGIFELMPVTECIRSMILDRASPSDIRREAASQGMQSLRQDGWRLVRSGRTTPEEVLRATKDEGFAGNGNGNGTATTGEAGS